jgi:hypothetical protein
MTHSSKIDKPKLSFPPLSVTLFLRGGGVKNSSLSYLMTLTEALTLESFTYPMEPGLEEM